MIDTRKQFLLEELRDIMKQEYLKRIRGENHIEELIVIILEFFEECKIEED